MPSAFLFYEYLVFTASLITHTSPGCSPTPRYSISPCVWSLITSYPQLLSKYYDLIYHITITSCFPGLAVHACSPYNSQFQTLTVITTRSSYNLVLPLAHRDWQRSPRSGAVAAAFTKLKIQWMYIIKTCSLFVSNNLTTDIGG